MTTRDFVLKAGGVICDCGAAILCAQFEVSEGATGNDEEEGDGGKNAEAAAVASNAKPPRRLARKMSLQCTECKASETGERGVRSQMSVICRKCCVRDASETGMAKVIATDHWRKTDPKTY